MMEQEVKISDVRFVSASQSEANRGLRGWVSFRVHDLLKVDGVAVRTTMDQRLVLSFPARRDRWGIEHAVVRPLDDRSRREIERAIFSALGLEEDPAR